MRQYVLLSVAALVLLAALIARSRLTADARPRSAAPGRPPLEQVLRAGEVLTAALRAGETTPAALDPEFAALATACAALATDHRTPAAESVCSRAVVLQQALHAGNPITDGTRALADAFETLAAEAHLPPG
jgi:hypothetical protein